MKRSTLILPLLGLAAILPAQNCSNTSVGFVPLSDLGTGTYQGLQGGLYLNGSNAIPAGHLAGGLAESLQVLPRNAAGAPDPAGRIVLLSIGMSNTSQEFSAFVPLANSDPSKNPAVLLVNGAQGGQTASIIANPNANFWSVITQRLQQAGTTAQQVQAVWLKEANAGPTNGFPGYYQELAGQLRTICQNIRVKYPNCRLCYVSSRIYAGYATTQLNPEPYAYESAFAVRDLVAAQIGGDPALNFDPAAGAVLSPWIAWGPYLWADGIVPRSDGLTWLCSDLSPDGTHPSPAGQQKVAQRLSAFFSAHATTTGWYLAAGSSTASLTPYGTGCPGTHGVPAIVANSNPFIGNPNFRVGVQNARQNSFATLFVSAAAAQVALGGGCTAWIDITEPNLLLPDPAVPATFPTTANGMAFMAFSIPADPALIGIEVFAQWAVTDPLGALNNAAALSRAVRIRVGVP